ncbi:MAG: YicC family protein [Oscillospiraceae bacterium]|nr:YicC family protein [Oscillospiraceae bacterium]
MIQSMTGYGRAKQGDTAVEIRSVNHRYLDINMRIPRTLSFLEESLREFIAGRLARGKVEVSLYVENLPAQMNELILNCDMLEKYLSIANVLERKYGMSNDLTASKILGLPDIALSVQKESDIHEKTREVLQIADLALNDFVASRKREGRRLNDDIREKIEIIRKLTEQIESRMPEVTAEYHDRLLTKIRETLGAKAIDESRILTEAALFADKASTDEEIVRLKIHIESLFALLDNGVPIGRKLDFLIQEFTREANTIGSKCSDSQTTKLVIDLKSEIEKIREQSQNIE